MPVKINGRVPLDGGDSRYSVEADLTQARIDRLLPGWVKPAGRQARMSFVMTSRPQSMRLDDLVIEGLGSFWSRARSSATDRAKSWRRT